MVKLTQLIRGLLVRNYMGVFDYFVRSDFKRTLKSCNQGPNAWLYLICSIHTLSSGFFSDTFLRAVKCNGDLQNIFEWQTMKKIKWFKMFIKEAFHPYKLSRSVIKRQKKPRLQVTTSDYEWLQATTRDYEPDYGWLQVTTSDLKWRRMTTRDYESSYVWLQLRLAITLGIKTFIVSYDYIDSCACYTSGEIHWKILAMQKQSFADVLQSKCS